MIKYISGQYTINHQVSENRRLKVRREWPPDSLTVWGDKGSWRLWRYSGDFGVCL